MLNEGQEGKVFLAANADRAAGAERILREHPEVDVFVLDDAFQHRRVARDLDVVLISAANPFGFGHVLPRGLLREGLAGLGRADVIIVTHSDQVSADELEVMERAIRKYRGESCILRAVHTQTSILTTGGELRMEELRGRKVFAFAGIANPGLFERQLRAYGEPVGRRWFGDHHDYQAGEIRALREEAKSAGAEALVTTEKDWAKIAGAYSEESDLPAVWRVEMELKFPGGDEERLVSKIRAVVG
jgi:tetraacyldisaccharide 4'-kinase